MTKSLPVFVHVFGKDKTGSRSFIVNEIQQPPEPPEGLKYIYTSSAPPPEAQMYINHGKQQLLIIELE